MLSELIKGNHVIGLKQTMRAVKRGQAKAVYVAEDAERKITEPLFELCSEKNVLTVAVHSMKELARALGVEVETAVAALLY